MQRIFGVCLLLQLVVAGGYKPIPEANLRYLSRRIAAQSTAPWKPFRLDYYYVSQPTSAEQNFFEGMLKVVQQFMQRYMLTRRTFETLQWKSDYPTDLGDGHVVPDAAKSKVWNADIVSLISSQVFFITLENDPNSNYLASAGPLIFEETTLRPIFGVITYNMGHVNVDQFNSNLFENNIQTIIHEIFHGLGFQDSMYTKYYDSVTGNTYQDTVTKTGKVLSVAVPRTVRFAQRYFDCPSITGIIMEDNGGSGSAGSHFERNIFYNEMMTASDVKGNIIFTEFSVQFLQDTGFYRFTDLQVDKIQWGKGKGCDFYNQNCRAQKFFDEFCKEKDASACSFYSAGSAQCDSETFSGDCMYQQIASNMDCRDQNIAGSPLTFQYFGFDSICVEGSFSKSLISQPLSCYQYSCSNNKLSLKIDGQTVDCSTPGEKAAPAGYQGSIKCPMNAQQICETITECPNQCNKRGYCMNAMCFCMVGFSGVDCMENCPNYRSGTRCMADCPAGTFKEEAIKSCIGCPFKCKSCTAIDSCSECEPGYRLAGGFCDISDSSSGPGQIIFRLALALMLL